MVEKGLKRFLNEKSEEEPKLIEIYVSPEWKYKVYNHAFEHGVKTIMKDMMSNPEIKKYGKEASKYMQQLIKSGVQPDISWSYESEFTTLTQAKQYIEQEIDVKVSILSADTSDHPKAKVAIPRRPGINFVME